MRILVKFASRSRPSRFLEGLDSILDLAANKGKIKVLAILDLDDGLADEYRAGLDNIKYGDVDYDFGYSKSKIDAINRPIPDHIKWDILVNFSDDMRFTVYGWDELIREGFRCNAPDGDAFLHYPESTSKNMLCTMSIIGRKYFLRDGWTYHPGFYSLWADNAAMEMAQLRKCYYYMGIQIYEHYHPAYGMAPWDEQYTRQQGFWAEDEIFFLYLKSHNFFLDGTEPQSSGC